MRLRGAGAQEGALPPLVNYPRRGTFTATRDRKQFFHILWKNLICDNIAAVSFLRLTREAGVLAMYGLCLLFA